MHNLDKEHLNGIYAELCSIIGLENTLMIYSNYKGSQVTFPVRLISKDFSERKILEEYDGTNLKALAKEYGYTERWVRQIIKNSNR